MDLEEIEVFIDPDGHVRVEVRGAHGSSCLDLTRGLEESLGGQVESRQMTPEALEESDEQDENRQQRGA